MPGLRVVWPILSVLVGAMLVMGFLIGRIEGWGLGDSAYFAIVSGLTIGYGDLVPKSPTSRLLAVCIGFSGILLTGLVAAFAVRALGDVARRERAR
ncbi:MAG TPA: potassium channel family protein [Burkholderiales bacterium]|nr:potassium channel family protein [Burkholderiales bacterium]